MTTFKRFLCLGFLFVPCAGCIGVPTPSAGSAKAVEDALVFHPSRYPEGDWKPEGLRYEDATFQSTDGVKLHGWFCPARQPRAVVLFAHGNAGNITAYSWKLRYLAEKMNLSVLAFDYRGYGKSEGRPSEEGILADARAARRWLAQRTGVAETDIVLMGYSLGGGVMVDLAARDGARGLILENTFSSLKEVASTKVSSARQLMTAELDSRSKIGAYHGPLLQTHGDADRVVPIAFAEKLFEAANEPKQLVRVKGGGHSETSNPEYVAALERFIANLPPYPGRPQLVHRNP